ncbi:hypothetical protein ALP25_200010 [Pseudomonas syringae pv. syringae]|nr:hypothetical protein ALP25_200010 [Pseudomonas syringae pv. syringae]
MHFYRMTPRSISKLNGVRMIAVQVLASSLGWAFYVLFKIFVPLHGLALRHVSANEAARFLRVWSLTPRLPMCTIQLRPILSHISLHCIHLDIITDWPNRRPR